ncbi:MAG: Gfo/Idh/MocA family oxidoreductase [Trichodesmium sp. St11_bin5]|nr:Gfo/Idh/MocA family oxidoreductase [Trichodesmium sp. St11_bin5]
MTQINISSSFCSIPIRVGIVGTGYAAKARAETLKADERSLLVTVAGHTPEKTEAFSQTFQVESAASWQQLVERKDLDLVIISTINRDHGAIALAALENNKHIIVEYPLSLDPTEAESLITLAKKKNKLLHVEHIELLGGLHNTIKESLSKIGKIFYARYVTINSKQPASQKWTYRYSLFGFPFVGALSRFHRFTDLFGQVDTVNCQSQFWYTEVDLYKACLCTAQLRFNNNVIGEVVYGKGETFWHSENTFTLYGEKGKLIFTPQQGQLLQGEKIQTIEVGARRGLFAKDTKMVIEYLLQGTPLYITPEASLYTLKVANLSQKSSHNSGKATQFK